MKVETRKGCVASALIVAACLLHGDVYAASFDCKRATTIQEKAICSDSHLSAKDSELNHVYRNALAQVSPPASSQMRQDQRQWLMWLTSLCNQSSSQSVDAIALCMNVPYTERIESLQNAVARHDGTVFYIRSIYLAGKDEDPHMQESPSAIYPGWGTLDVHWYQADTSTWSAWNDFIMQDVMKTAGRDGTTRLEPSDAAGSDTSFDMAPPSVMGNLVTALVTVQTMGHGAAHPGEAWWSVHWLKDQKRPMTADDVFRKETPWRQALADACWVSLRQQFPEEGTLFIKTSHDKQLIEVVENPANWMFSKEGLTIGFPEYAVAPRVSSVEDIDVPWSSFKPFLQPNFQTSLSLTK